MPGDNRTPDRKSPFIISPRTRTRARTLIGISLIILTGVVMVWFLRDRPISGWDFQINLWEPASWLLSGQSPYGLDAVQDGIISVWMPAVIGALFPLGLLSRESASNIWFVINLMALLGSVMLAAGAKKPAVILLAISAVMVAVFPSTIAHLRIGQITILATFIYLVVVLFKDRLGLVISALLVVLALAKPQLGILAVPGIFFMTYRQGGWRDVAKFIGALLFWLFLLSIPLFIGFPGWLADFWLSMRQIPNDWLQPGLFTLLPLWLGSIGTLFWGVLALSLLGLNIWIWLRIDPEEAIFWSLALTPLVTPYVWSWDFVMILPLFAKTIMSVGNKLALIILGLGYLLCWILMFRINSSDNFSNHLFWWVPWLLLATITGARLIASDRKKFVDSFLTS